MRERQTDRDLRSCLRILHRVAREKFIVLVAINTGMVTTEHNSESSFNAAAKAAAMTVLKDNNMGIQLDHSEDEVAGVDTLMVVTQPKGGFGIVQDGEHSNVHLQVGLDPTSTRRTHGSPAGNREEKDHVYTTATEVRLGQLGGNGRQGLVVIEGSQDAD